MVTIQKNGKPWKDESGIEIPFNRVSKVEITKERLADKLYKSALKINAELRMFNNLISTANADINKAIEEENAKLQKSMRTTKGNFTWFNFDRSIKIEANVNETIKFDEGKIAAAREIFDRFIEKNVQGTDDIVRQLINTAFANQKGGLDSKKVLSLLKFRTKVKDKQFHAALDLIESSISRPSSKRYFRVWQMGEDGQYENIELNFSSVT